MITSGLDSIENKPQDQQQLHGGKKIGQIKKFYMTFAIKLYFMLEWSIIWTDLKRDPVKSEFTLCQSYG